MKKILSLIYLSLPLILAGCASDTIADMEQNHAGTRDFEWSKRIYGVMPQFETDDDQLQSRSSYVFDNATKSMKFGWNGGDAIGVFAVDEENPSNQAQQVFSATTVNAQGSMSATFTADDGKITSLAGRTQYLAYYPVISTHDTDYTNIHVSYENQKQGYNVNIQAFYKNNTSDAYLVSEKNACAHLPQFDYSVAAPITTTNKGGADFSFTRMGSVVRFYLKAPDNVIFDSLQVVNNEADFILTADMDARQTVSSSSFHNARTSHKVSLQFEGGFDLTDKSSDHYREYASPEQNVGYIIAYMMFAPIDLTSKINSTLYLLGHKVVGGETVHLYYRATTALKPINIAQNKVQQWQLVNGDDEPITFEPISVQEWYDGTTLNNGENGEGTQGW